MSVFRLIEYVFFPLQTALSYMCSTNATHFLEALLRVPGIDINRPDNELNTPLHYAAECGMYHASNSTFQFFSKTGSKTNELKTVNECHDHTF